MGERERQTETETMRECVREKEIQTLTKCRKRTTTVCDVTYSAAELTAVTPAPNYTAS